MTILAAVGGEHEQDRVVEVGRDLARAHDEDLVVLHVMDEETFEEVSQTPDIQTPVMVPGAVREAGLAYAPPEEERAEYTLADGMGAAEEVARECASRTLSKQSDVRVVCEGRVGDPATEIVDEAERSDARYVVVGGRNRNPGEKALFGSVSERVILDADRPVMTVTRDE